MDKLNQLLCHKEENPDKFREQLSEFQQVDELSMPDCPICEEPLEVCTCRIEGENLHHKWFKESLDDEVIPF